MQDDTRETVDIYRKALRQQGFSASAIYQRVRLLRGIGVPPELATRNDVLRQLDRATAKSTRRVYLNMLRTAFRDMRDLGLVDHDPTFGLRTPSPPRARPRPMNTHEIESVLSVGGRVRAWSILGYRAGLRAHEVVAVRKEHLRWTNHGWTLHVVGKGGVVAAIPAHAEVVALLQSYPDYDGRLWPINPSTMSSAWRVAAESVGVRGRRFHDLRHTFATQVLNATGDLLVTRDLLRHASVQTTQIYALPDESRAFDAVAGL